MLQKASVADEGGVEGGSGDIKAGVSVEETELDKIRTHESPEGTESCFGGRPTRTFFDSRFQIEIRKVVNLRDIAGDRGIRVVENIAGQRSNTALNYQSVVRIDTTPLRLSCTP
jgi:hypothetical protein